ncbi:MAG: DUF4388 domain-containing protein, partial [Acidobacteriota bacterium]
RGDETRHLFFEKGELRTATSSREGQRIGAFLKRRGWITDEDLSWALETVAKQGRARLGKILVEKGLVSRQVLDAEMRRLVEEIVFSTFEWDQGEYRFQSSTGVLDPDVALTLSTAAIIVEGIRRLPENDTFQKRLGDPHAVPSLAREPMSRYQYLPLTPQEAYLLSRIDGALDLESLLKIGGGSRGSAAKTLYALFSCGIVEWKTEGTATGHAGGFEGLNVVVDLQPPDAAPGHAELVKNTYRRIDWLTHYELLGVASTATTEQIGKAYFERSRLFHPDLRHRGDLRQFERELAAVFERLKLAHDVLSDADHRVEYDESLDAAPVSVAVAETSADPEVRRHLAEQSYRRARELIAQKDFHPAVEMMREAIRFVPDNAEYRMCLGQVELRNSLWIPKGLENLKEAARLEPRRVPFIRTAARALHEHGRNEEAEPFARRLVDLDPSPEHQELLGSILAGAVPPPVEEEPDADPLAILDSPTSPDEVTLERSAAAMARAQQDRPGLLSRIFRSRN